MKPRVLVTGAFGFLGLALVRKLSDFETVALGHASRSPLARGAIPANVHLIEGDLNAVNTLLGDAAPFDAIVHLAGGGGAAKCAKDPVGAVRNNIDATTALSLYARRTGVRRLLFASTIVVYGTHSSPQRPYFEDDVIAPDDLYGVVKASAERIWTGVAGGSVLRLANIYGAGSGVDVGVNGAAERFARAAASGGQLSITGGAQRIDYVHIDDVVDAFRLALGAPTLSPVLNVGGGDPISIADLAELFVQAGRDLGVQPSLERVPASADSVWPDRCLDISLIADELGWKPRVPYRTGVAGLVEMMQTHSKP
jgi:UDP-glucose 4-epimerase